MLLFFRGIDLVEDPSPDAASQVPHLKGDVAESMIIHIYQHYCQINIAHPDTMSMGQNKGASRNFMSLEEFILFMDDCGVGGTHVPRDESDRPQQSYKDQLDPVRLVLSTQSPNLGGVGMEVCKVSHLSLLFTNFVFFFHQCLPEFIFNLLFSLNSVI